MDVTAINASEEVFQEAQKRFQIAAQEYTEEFETVFQSALGMVDETSDLHNQANSEMIRFALGESDNTHDLVISMEKANTALQYTVAVKDKILEGYREIMQMQI